MKKHNPNYDHNIFKKWPEYTAPNTVDLVSPEILEKFQSGQLWFLGHNLRYKNSKWSDSKKEMQLNKIRNNFHVDHFAKFPLQKWLME